MKYFTNCKTPEEAKALRKSLSKQLHPDMPNGNKEAFQEMEQEYLEFIKFAFEKEKKQSLNTESLNKLINHIIRFFKEEPELMNIVIKSLFGSDFVRNLINKNSSIIETGINFYNFLKQK